MIKKISLNGDRNITIQSDKEIVFNLNVGDIKKCLSFFKESISDYNEIESLKSLVENKNLYADDWTEFLERFEAYKFLKSHFEFTGYLKGFDTNKLLRLRKQFYKEFYEIRKYDSQLYDYFNNKNKNILLIGNSLAGKTRMVIELIKKLGEHDSDYFIYVPYAKEYKKGFYKGIGDNSVTKIAILDDLDKYYEFKTANILIEELIENGVKIIGTCKTGPEYKNYKIKSTAEIKDVINVIDIQKKKLKQDELSDLVTKFNVKIEETEYDGNIGSLLLPITKMRERYQLLNDLNSIVGELSINYLKSIKALNYASNFYSKGTFEISKLDDFCLRLTIGRFAGLGLEANSILEKSLAEAQKKIQQKKIESFYEERDNALAILESDKTNLNFINRTPNLIEIEEVYLEKIVEYSPFEAYTDINKIYNKNEQKSKGFFAKPFHYNNAIRKSENYSTSKSLYYKMIKQGIKPNQETYSMLIRNSEDEIEIKRWKQKATKKQLLSVDIFGELLKKAETVEDILSILEEFISIYEYLYDFSEESISWFFHIICFKPERIKIDIFDIINLFVEKNIYVTSQAFVLAVHKVASFENGISLLGIADLHGVELPLSFFTNLVQKSNKNEEQKVVFSELAAREIQLDDKFFHPVLQQAQNHDAAKEILILIKDEGIIPNIEFFNVWVNKTDNYNEAKDIFITLDEYSNIPTIEFFNEMSRKVTDILTTNDLIEKISQTNLKISETVYTNCIWYISTLVDALCFIDENIFYKPESIINNFQLTISEDKNPLIKNYIKEIAQHRHDVPVKLLANYILSINMERNLDDDESKSILLNMFRLNKKFFYDEFKKEIETAPNT